MQKNLFNSLKLGNILRFDHIRSFLNSGHDRSIRAKKNVFISLGIRFIDILTGLILVPVSLNYLDPQRYGIWLTIESIVGWFILFDIGLGNGLRNKFAEAYAKKDVLMAKMYISTSYAIISMICSALILVLIVVNNFVNWSMIINAPPSLKNDVSILALFVFSSFAVRLVLNLINMLWFALQFPVVKYSVEALSKLITLGILLIMKSAVVGTLISLSAAYILPPLFLLFLVSVFTFKNYLKDYRPSLRSIDFRYARPLMGLGIKFFVVQMGYIILFLSDNLILSHLYNPAVVTPYQISHKYFSLISTVFFILLSPMWSATTEAFTKGDYFWIDNAVKSYKRIWVYFVLATIIMLSVSPWIYHLWIGDRIQIPFSLSACWALLVIVQCLSAIYTHVINGVGYLYVQIIGALFTIVMNIPLSIFFANNLNFGPQGVVLATVVSFIFYLITRFVQYQKIIQKKATGIWGQ